MERINILRFVDEGSSGMTERLGNALVWIDWTWVLDALDLLEMEIDE